MVWALPTTRSHYGTSIQSEGIPVQKVDVDNNPKICQEFGVRNVPTVVLQVDNTEVGRKVGLNPKQAYLDMYNQN